MPRDKYIAILIKKMNKKFPAVIFFPIFGHQNRGSGTGSRSGSALGYGSGSGSALGSGYGSGSANRKNVGSGSKIIAFEKEVHLIMQTDLTSIWLTS
jgi:hypothetical protein